MLWSTALLLACERGQGGAVDTSSFGLVCSELEQFSTCFEGAPGCVPVICADTCLAMEQPEQWAPYVSGPVIVPYSNLVRSGGYCDELELGFELELCTPEGEVCYPGDPDAPCPEDWYARVACRTGDGL